MATCFAVFLPSPLVYNLVYKFILYQAFHHNLGFIVSVSAGHSDDNAADLGTCLCTATVSGVYPILAVNDIRGIGCAQGYSRKRLWDLFSIDRQGSRHVYHQIHCLFLIDKNIRSVSRLLHHSLSLFLLLFFSNVYFKYV